MSGAQNAVQYASTRNPSRPFAFREALLSGIAPDGGLFAPVEIPAIPAEAWRTASSMAELGARILPFWMGEDAEIIARIAADALTFDAPLVRLDGGKWDGVHVLELFHGPTLSFKDFGARTMARLMNHYLRDQDESLTILVATSGDTGSAVADGFAGLEKIRVVLLYPKGQVSPVQERQLIVERPGVTALAVLGTFDDCQRMVKEAFLDTQLADVPLSSANSINIGRLLPQMLYYFRAVQQAETPDVTFCVPSGNLGNLTGGILAALAGLSVSQFIAAHNANDFFPRFLSGGTADFSPSVRTLSNAMDVGAPSNFERLRVLLSGDDLRRRIRGVSVTDEQTVATMRDVYEQTGYVADPHTAVGLEAVRRRRAAGEDGAYIVLSTAHPAKFPETVQPALNFTPETPERLAKLWQEPTAVAEIPPALDALRQYLLVHARA